MIPRNLKNQAFFFKHDTESIRSLEIELEKEIEEINKDSTLSEEDKKSMINALYMDMDPSQDYDYYIHKQGEAIYNFYKNNKKQYQYEELKDFLSNFNTKDEYIVQLDYTLIIQSKLLKLSQLKRMIRVYINYGVKINDYRLCESIFDRSKFRKTVGKFKNVWC